MTPLSISADLPAHTRTWLSYLDSAIAERAFARLGSDDDQSRIDETWWQHSRATGNTAYFLNLYGELLEDQAWARTRRSVSRMVPRIPARVA